MAKLTRSNRIMYFVILENLNNIAWRERSDFSCIIVEIISEEKYLFSNLFDLGDEDSFSNDGPNE